MKFHESVVQFVASLGTAMSVALVRIVQVKGVRPIVLNADLFEAGTPSSPLRRTWAKELNPECWNSRAVGIDGGWPGLGKVSICRHEDG